MNLTQTGKSIWLFPCLKLLHFPLGNARPQIFFRDSFEEANELKKELRNEQYLVEVDEVNDEESGEI